MKISIEGTPKELVKAMKDLTALLETYEEKFSVICIDEISIPYVWLIEDKEYLAKEYDQDPNRYVIYDIETGEYLGTSRKKFFREV